MVSFNTTRYSFGGGNLSEGFQGRPDLQQYGNSVKRSQNFISDADGVERFRKNFKQGPCAAPVADVSNTTTGAVYTAQFYIPPSASTEGATVFCDFCRNVATGKLSVVYFRGNVASHAPQGFRGASASLASFTAGGEITLSVDIPTGLQRVGSYLKLAGAPASIGANVIISEIITSRKVKVVKDTGEPITALTSLTGVFYSGFVINTPIDEDTISWVETPYHAYAYVGGGIVVTDGAGIAPFRLDAFFSAGSFVFSQAAIVFTADPTPASDTASVVFFHQGRLGISGFDTDPSLIALSRITAVGGVPSWYDFTTGALATDAIIVNMAPASFGAIKKTKWARGTKNVLLVGVDSGIIEITSDGVAVSPTDIGVSIFSFRNPSSALPVVFDNFVDWVSADQQAVLESSFALGFDAEVSYTPTRTTSIRNKVKQLVAFTGKSEGLVLLGVNGDLTIGVRSGERTISFFPMSVFLGRTVAAEGAVANMYVSSDVEGDTIHLNVLDLEGQHKILKISIEEMFRYDFIDIRPELFAQTKTYNKVVTTFANGAGPNYLDDSFSNSVPVSTLGTELEITESDNTTYDLKILSDTGVALAGKQILIPELGMWIEYASEITPGGNFYADYVFEKQTISNDMLPIKLGPESLSKVFTTFSSFTISTNSLLSAGHQVVGDGLVDDAATIVETTDGYGHFTVTLSDPVFFAHVGLTYKGLMTMLPITTSGSGQQGYNRPKSIAEIKVRLLNSGDGSIYVNHNSQNLFQFKNDWILNAKRYFDGIFSIRPSNSWQEVTEITFTQEEPQPLNISFIDIFMEATSG